MGLGLTVQKPDGLFYGAKVDASWASITQSVFGTLTVGYSW